MRIRISGELDQGFGYFLLTNLIRSSVVLDAYVFYKVSPDWRLDAGQFRAPSGAEYTTIAGEIDFVDRSWVSDRLGPGRQTGVQISGGLIPRTLLIKAGIFNGNGIGNVSRYQKNDNDQLMVAGRLDYYLHYRNRDFSLTDDVFRLGLSGFLSNDSDVRLAGGEPDSIFGSFSGTRQALTGDFRFQQGPLLVSGEATVLKTDFNPGTYSLTGFHLSSGWMVTSDIQLMIRYQEIRYDGLTTDQTEWISGLNWFPAEPIKFQFNVSIPQLENPEHFRLIAKWQLMF